jgi:hypothetical protein
MVVQQAIMSVFVFTESNILLSTDHELTLRGVNVLSVMRREVQSMQVDGRLPIGQR